MRRIPVAAILLLATSCDPRQPPPPRAVADTAAPKRAVPALAAGRFAGSSASVHGDRTSFTAGHGTDELAFSPDGSRVASLWRQGTSAVGPPVRGGPAILTQSIELRWRATDGEAPESRVTLDERDHRPAGTHGRLEARLAFSPDSRRLAAATPRQGVVIDLRSGRVEPLRLPPGQSLTTLAWRAGDELVYGATTGGVDTFHRQRVDSDGKLRPARQIFRQTRAWGVPDESGGPPLSFGPTRVWSPDGSSVVFQHDRRPMIALLDVDAGSMLPLLDHLSEVSYRRDGNQLLVRGNTTPSGTGAAVLLVDARAHTVTDLTARFSSLVGPTLELDLDGPAWELGGRHVIVQDMRSNRPRGLVVSHVVQIEPWRVVRSSREFLRASPVEGWLLEQHDAGEGTFDWLELAGTRRQPLGYWANDLVWAPGATRAARLVDEQVELLRIRPPSLPTAR